MSDPRICPNCGAEVPADFRFCGRCGTPLDIAETSSSTSALPVSASGPGARGAASERRQLTVMFCDLVGSTALSERLDPEDLHQLIRDYQTEAVAVAERFEGHVAQYLGDGLMIYFGFPTAHEDDPRRAVLAGLGIAEAVQELRPPPGADRDGNDQSGESGESDEPEPRLAVRIGVHTGTVVAGEVGAGARTERLAMGETPNVAARLQGLAEPGQVVVSGATKRLVGDHLAFENLGSHTVKGLSRPLQVYRAVGEMRVTGVVDLARLAALAPPVGRAEEMDRLLAALDDVNESRGRLTRIWGEAGIGKSRLVEALAAQAAADGFEVLAGRTSAYRQNAPLYPFRELLERSFGDPAAPPAGVGASSPAQQAALAARLRRGLAALPELHAALPDDLGESETLALLGALMGLPAEHVGQLPPWMPQRLRERQLTLLTELLLARARRRPLLVVLEDLHWVDPSTLEWLEAVRDRLDGVPLLVAVTHRPSFSPTWEVLADEVVVEVGMLDEGAARQVIRDIARKELPPEVVQEIVSRTDGVPLFLEELTRMLLESEHLVEEADGYRLRAPLPSQAIPSTLRDSLTARLDRMDEAKTVAQLAAVLGREFDLELMAAVSPRPRAALRADLERLVGSKLMRATGPGTYMFRHALLLDAAYSSLLRKTRQRLHAQVASVLLTEFPARAEDQPEVMAHHFIGAGRDETAVDWLVTAGRHSLRRAANREAVRQVERALGLLESRPETPNNRRRELLLHAVLGPALTALRGFTAPDVAQAYNRALELVAEVDDAPQLFWITWGLWAHHFSLGDPERTLALARRLEELAEERPALRLQARYTVGATWFCRGELLAARQALEAGLAEETEDAASIALAATGQDPGMAVLCYLALTLWLLGESEASRRHLEAGVQRAREGGHPLGLVLSLVLATLWSYFRRDHRALERYALEAVQLSQEQGLYFGLQAELFLGWMASTSEGPDGRDGLERAAEVVHQFQATGARSSLPLWMAVLAEGHLRQDEPAAALEAVEQGLRAAEELGERYWLAELWRLKGEIARAGGGDPREDYRRARNVARDQDAKALMTRVEASLGELGLGGFT